MRFYKAKIDFSCQFGAAILMPFKYGGDVFVRPLTGWEAAPERLHLTD
jgi:hypothetical protein